MLIPDNLFYAHMELADVLSQIKGAEAAIPHLNRMVAYAPAYPLSHLKLAIQLARNEDWDSARAACLNALRVALDRDDAAFATTGSRTPNGCSTGSTQPPQPTL